MPYIQTFKLWALKDVSVHWHVQAHRLGHTSGVHCPVSASSAVAVLVCALHRIQWPIVFISSPECPEAGVKAVAM